MVVGGGGGGGRKRQWREEIVGAGAVGLVLEVFSRRRGQTALALKHRSPSPPAVHFPPDSAASERQKASLHIIARACHAPWQGPPAFPPPHVTYLAMAHFTCSFIPVLKQATR